MADSEGNKISVKIYESTWNLLKDTQHSERKRTRVEPTIADLIRDSVSAYVGASNRKSNASNAIEIGDNAVSPQKDLPLVIAQAIAGVQSLLDRLQRLDATQNVRESEADCDPEAAAAIRDADARVAEIVRQNAGVAESVPQSKPRKKG